MKQWLMTATVAKKGESGSAEGATSRAILLQVSDYSEGGSSAIGKASYACRRRCVGIFWAGLLNLCFQSPA